MRHTPSLFNVVHSFFKTFFWDGRVSKNWDGSWDIPEPKINGPEPELEALAKTFESAFVVQSVFPFTSPDEMLGKESKLNHEEAWDLVLKRIFDGPTASAYNDPFVKKHYASGNMQALQKKYTEKNIIWLSINSSAPGKQGHVTTDGAMEEKKLHQSNAMDILLDTTGPVGKIYGAKTTPHMFIIDPEGKLAYQGAIDDHPDTDPSSISSSKNFVKSALEELKEGKKPSIPTTKAYGCSVKY